MSGAPYFESHAESYADQIMSVQREFYENAGKLLNSRLPQGGRVLDIGNGGVINYDHARLSRLDCADLTVSQTAVRKYAACPNIRFLRGDIFNLSGLPSGSYDAVIVQAVIHHLAGPSFQDTRSRVSSAMAECLRVLRDGGLLFIMESTVVPWFERVERLLYPLMQAFFTLCRFGRVYQFSPKSLAALLSRLDGAELLSSENVEVGRFIWIMGRRIPRKLTPCGVTFYVLKKKTQAKEPVTHESE